MGRDMQPSDRFYEVVEEQGWSQETLVQFYQEFLVQKGLLEDFEMFVTEKAQEENAYDASEGD